MNTTRRSSNLKATVAPESAPDPEKKRTQSIPLAAHQIDITFVADRQKIYDAWNALANLADVTGTISIHVTATVPEGYDKAKLENSVLEPLRELGLLDDEQGPN